MPLHYGNESQFNVGAPQCGGGFAVEIAWHYFMLIYLPFISLFATFFNTWVCTLLLSDDAGHKLLQQSQHVYVLGTAITNILVATVCNIPQWLAYFVLPCIDLGVVSCFISNLVNFAGSYQVLFNVYLLCYDRWRLVKLGAKYVHELEARRAKLSVCITSAISICLFLVPEIGTPLLTGVWTATDRESSEFRCPAMQVQSIAQLGGLNPGNILVFIIILLQWIMILVYALRTTWKLYRRYQTKTSSIGPAIVLGSAATLHGESSTGGGGGGSSAGPSSSSSYRHVRRLVRASLVMFGMVAATLVSSGPLAIALAVLQFNPEAVAGYQVRLLLYLSFSAPALDPIVFIATLPKLRARARNSWPGRSSVWLLKRTRQLLMSERFVVANTAQKTATSTINT